MSTSIESVSVPEFKKKPIVIISKAFYAIAKALLSISVNHT